MNLQVLGLIGTRGIQREKLRYTLNLISSIQDTRNETLKKSCGVINIDRDIFCDA